MPIKVAESLPEQDTITPEQEKMVEQFVAEQFNPNDLPPAYKGDGPEDLKITAYKYLTARKWKMEDAVKMFKDAMAFRQEKKFDGFPVFPTPIPIRGYDVEKLNATFGLEARQPDHTDVIYNHVKTAQHFGFHYWDKMGHPVVIDCAGKSNAVKLVSHYKELTPPGEDIAQCSIDLHLHQNIVGAHLVKYQDKTKASAAADGRRITSATIIMDARDLTLGHLFGEAIEITKKTWAQDSAYFPEGMHRMFVVNCPSMIMIGYSLFKGMIDKRTQDKVTFCSPEDTAAVLRTVIDPKILPKFLGGECECEGGCVYDEKVAEAPSTEDAFTKTLDLTIKAGSSWEKSYDVLEAHEICWKWESTTGSDVEFSVVFTPAAEGAEAVTAVAPIKLKKGDDFFKAPAAGKVVVKLDNGFSWMKEKVVRVRIVKVDTNHGLDLASPASPTAPAPAAAQ